MDRTQEIGVLLYPIVNNTMRKVNLEFTNLDPETIVAIGNTLKNNTFLLDLQLGSNDIGPDGTVVISKALESNTTLLHLGLDFTNLGPNGAIAIGHTLQTNTSLQRLNIDGNKIGSKGAVAIGQSLETNNNLQILEISENNIGPEGGVAIGQSLKTNNSLVELNICDNHLGTTGCVAICNSIQTNNTLLELWINDNSIGPEGGVAIGEFLKTNNTLRSLHMLCNNIGPKGAVAIGQSVQNNNNLQRLDIRENYIGPEGGVAIGQSLKTNKSLLHLYLCSNDIGNKGALDIGLSLETNNTLLDLGIGDNKLDNEGALAVIRGIAVNNQNTRISNLDISSNNITRLPSELSQFPHTMQWFEYQGNPIDYIPPNVQRWLDRFQQQQNNKIHQDSQNVHNRQIQKCIQDSLNKIINATDAPKYQCLDEVREIIVNDPILSTQCKTQLIEYALDKSEHTGLGITFCEALQYVFTRIDLMPKRGDNIKAILNEEMNDALCMCFTGRISRLLNCLTGIDPLVHIHIVNLSDMFTNVGKRLIEQRNYSTEDHQAQFEKELEEDYGYEMTDVFRKELDEMFYCVIEEFYETFSELTAVGRKRKSKDTDEPEAKREKRDDKDEKNTKKTEK